MVCSKQPSGGGLHCSGATRLLGLLGIHQTASMTRTILRSELNCQSHHHHHRRLQQSVHSDINGSFGVQYAYARSRGNTPSHVPPGRTTVEHLILEFHRMACHTLQACKLQRGSPTTGGKAHSKSTHSNGPVSVRDMCMYGPPGHRFLTHPPAHLETNHRPGLPEFLDSRCR